MRAIYNKWAQHSSTRGSKKDWREDKSYSIAVSQKRPTSALIKIHYHAFQTLIQYNAFQNLEQFLFFLSTQMHCYQD